MAENKKPLIRFKGFTDAWERKKAKELFISTADKGHPQLPVLSATQDRGMIKRDDNGINIFHDKKNEEGYKRVVPGQFVIHLRSFQGGFAHSAIEGITSPAYTVFGFSDQESHNDIFWKYIFNSKGFIRRLGTVTYGIRDGRSISYDEFLTMNFLSPNKEEQTKIGEFFRTLDNLIELNRQEIEKLKNIKKAMLEKMFPQNGSDVPEIRFKGFTDAWKQRKFSDIFINLQNNTLSRAELSSVQGVAKNVHYGDVLIKFGECLDVSKEALPYICNEETVIKYKASYLQNGDVIIADTAEDETVGKCSEIVGLDNETVISGLHTVPCRPLVSFAIGYLGYYMNSVAYHNQLLPLMQGTKVTSISKSALQTTVVSYPKSKVEQQQIGDFFKHFDNLIELNQQEVEKLKNIKKSCIEKMFV